MDGDTYHRFSEVIVNNSFNDQMLKIVAMYLRDGGTHPIDLDKLATYARNGGHWEKSGSAILHQMCKRDFSRAMREKYHTDKQGRVVRTFHATTKNVGGKQQVFWDETVF